MFKYILLVALIGACSALDGEAAAEIKSLENEINPEGAFHYAFQTSNGIDVNAAGDEKAISGGYKYVSADGVNVALTYVADAEGYHPSGDILPTPPPIPEAIARAIAYNLAHPQTEEALKG